MSTSHAVMELIEEINSKNHAIGVFIDLKKAFVTVNHGILIKKLNYFDVHGVANYWIKSCLSNKKQFGNIDRCVLGLLDVTCGVSQGSILDPRLFVLYVNDICNV